MFIEWLLFIYPGQENMNILKSLHDKEFSSLFNSFVAETSLLVIPRIKIKSIWSSQKFITIFVVSLQFQG